MQSFGRCQTNGPQVDRDKKKQELGPGRRDRSAGSSTEATEAHKPLDTSHVQGCSSWCEYDTTRARAHALRAPAATLGRGAKLLKRLRKAKKNAPENEKPVRETTKTHNVMRESDQIILPEMVASVIGVYNGLNFTQGEVKPDMVRRGNGGQQTTDRRLTPNAIAPPHRLLRGGCSDVR